MNQSLRGQLTLWYITSTIIIFTLLTGLFSSLLWYSLHTQIDHHIHIVTTQAQQIVDDFNGQEREKLLTNLVSFEGMSIVVMTEKGQSLYQTQSLDMKPLSSADLLDIEMASHTHGYHPLHFTIANMRFGIAHVEFENTPALLAVGYSVSIVRQTFYQLMLILLGVMLTTIIPFTFIGQRMLAKYLYPLEVIATTAQQVSKPQQLSTRVTGLTLTEELKTIVSSFNTMLSRLQSVFQTEYEFFSQTAHTLKTPLAVLRSKVEGLTKESTGTKNSMLAIIDNSVETIQDLLLISRIETGIVGAKEKVCLSEISLELIDLAQSLAQEKQVKVTSNIQSGIYFSGDIRLIRRALGNIVHNALDYVPHSGEVSLHLSQHKNTIFFSVENSSEKISAKDLAHVFERFYRAENAKEEKGSGLGLAITKAIVESYNGEIAFDYKQKKVTVGVTFEV